MAVTVSDIKHVKSKTETNTTTNGGPPGTTPVVFTRNNIFPRVTQTDRTSGITRYRKTFKENKNASDEIAYDFTFWPITPSTSGDRIYWGMGHMADTQASFGSGGEYPHWTGCGTLNANVTAGATSVQIAMESNDYEFQPGGYLSIIDWTLSGQTIESTVRNGDSVELVGGTWVRRDPTSNVNYPFGFYIGSNRVFTYQSGMNYELPRIAEGKTTDEVLGTGNGTTTPTVAGFGNIVNGVNFKGVYTDSRITGWTAMKPTLTITVSATPVTLTFDADGYLLGATAGRISMSTGAWLTAPTFITAPDNGSSITATYWDKPHSWSGNVVTVNLSEPVANNYLAANSHAGGCLRVSEMKPLTRGWTETSVSGTYDETTYPVSTKNHGTVYDTWTITFTSPTAFSCAGIETGAVGTGVISSNFAPVNPLTGTPYFTVSLNGWGGAWTSGDQIQFVTEPADMAILWKEVVPASTAAHTNNLVVYGTYFE